MCGLGDHSLEDFPKIIVFLNKMSVNLLQTFPKNEILNSKNLHLVTRSGEPKANSHKYHQLIRPIKNTTKYLHMQGKNDIMKKVVDLFMKETEQQ